MKPIYGVTVGTGLNPERYGGNATNGKSAYELALEHGFEGTEEEWLESLKGEPGEKGAKGDSVKGDKGDKGNGIKSAVLNADYTLTITFDDGTSYTTPSIRGATGATGATGSAGAKGADGVGIASVKQTTTSTADDGNNVFTVTLTNGTTATFTVQNGSKGSPGTNGTNGTSVTVKSVSESTADGGSNIIAFSDGTTVTIKNGSKGSAGAAGKTPVRGTDYWTPTDREAIVQDVLTYLGGVPVFGVVDANNNIILTGNLAEGVYVLKYEDADGNVTEIGTLNHSNVPEPTYTNLFDPATATLNQRMSGTSSAPKAADGYVITALITIPETAVSKTSNEAYIAVPASMWSGSANMFLASTSDSNYGYCAANTTKGEVVGGWVKIPLLTEWGTGFTCVGVTVSLYVKGSAITASDIQNIEIYFNECPE